MYTKIFLGILVAVVVALFITASVVGPVTRTYQQWTGQGTTSTQVEVTKYVGWNTWLKAAVGMGIMVSLIVLITAWSQSMMCWNAPYDLSRVMNTYEKQRELLSEEVKTGNVTPAGEGLQLKSKLANSIARIQTELQWIRYIDSSAWWMFGVSEQRIEIATGKRLRDIEQEYCPTLSSKE